MAKDSAEAVDKPVKKRKNSKAKGSGFENTVAKLLSKGLAPLNFIRTQGSGARVGGQNFATIGKMFGNEALKLFVGDVVPVNEQQERLRFRFSVETKFYATQDHFTALTSGNALIYGWFEESVADAGKINKNPMLIFKWNHTPTFVAVETGEETLTTVKPSLVIGRPNSRTLAIYKLEDLLTDPSFWMVRET